MKKIVIIFCCVLLFSCKVQKTTLSPFVAVYKENGDGHNIYPSYILLRTRPNVFETYSPMAYTCTFGQWNINNDTLFLFPKYEYFSRDLKLKMSEITQQDTSVATIPQQYLIKNDCLIDITDYSIILPELFSNQNYKAVYKRVNNQ
jgi:hypothetical protein